jgi:hypothetical protein
MSGCIGQLDYSACYTCKHLDEEVMTCAYDGFYDLEVENDFVYCIHYEKTEGK